MEEAEAKEAKMSRQERRVEARKARILEAAAHVFARKGYGQATTREIAEEADVSEGSIFYHFGSKRDLLLNIMDQLIVDATMREMLAQTDMSDPRVSLVDILRNRLEIAERNRELMQAIFTEVHHNAELRRQFFKEIALPLISHFETLIMAHSQAGVFRPLNPTIVTRAILSVFLVFNLLVLTGVDEKLAAIPRHELAEGWADLFLYGLLSRQEGER